MPAKVIQWIKNNKLTAFLLLLVFYFLFRNGISNIFGSSSRSLDRISTSSFMMGAPVAEAPSINMELSDYAGSTGSKYSNNNQIAPQPNVQERKTITETAISLLVTNIRESMETIKNNVNSAGGYVIDSNMTKSQTSERADMTVRVKSENLDNFLSTLRVMSVKVTSEKIKGKDITDQYADIERKITKLEQTITRLEEIMEDSNDIDQILNIQQRIFSQQDQVDRYKGQLMYMDGASSTSLVTIYLSTDEQVLPYVEPLSWRPSVIFKQASRSLIHNLQSLGTMGIWVIVYSVIWIPILATYILVKKTIFKRKTPENKPTDRTDQN